MDSLQYDGHCRERTFFTPFFLLYYFFTQSSLYLPTRDEDVLILLPSTQDMPRSHLPGAGSWCLGGFHGWGELSCQHPSAHCAEALFTEHSFLFSTSSTLYSGMLSGPDFSLVLSHSKVTSKSVATIFRFRVKNISSF